MLPIVAWAKKPVVSRRLTDPLKPVRGKAPSTQKRTSCHRSDPHYVGARKGMFVPTVRSKKELVTWIARAFETVRNAKMYFVCRR